MCSGNVHAYRHSGESQFARRGKTTAARQNNDVRFLPGQALRPRTSRRSNAILSAMRDKNKVSSSTCRKNGRAHGSINNRVCLEERGTPWHNHRRSGCRDGGRSWSERERTCMRRRAELDPRPAWRALTSPLVGSILGALRWRQAASREHGSREGACSCPVGRARYRHQAVPERPRAGLRRLGRGPGDRCVGPGPPVPDRSTRCSRIAAVDVVWCW